MTDTGDRERAATLATEMCGRLERADYDGAVELALAALSQARAEGEAEGRAEEREAVLRFRRALEEVESQELDYEDCYDLAPLRAAYIASLAPGEQFVCTHHGQIEPTPTGECPQCFNNAAIRATPEER